MKVYRVQSLPELDDAAYIVDEDGNAMTGVIGSIEAESICEKWNDAEKAKSSETEVKAPKVHKAKPLTEDVLTLMKQDATKEAGLIIKLTLKDGSTRRGIYQDLMPDPLNRIEYKGILFIKLFVKRDNNMTVYLPVSSVATVEWSY